MNLEHLFSDEQRAVRDTLRRFVDIEIMPLRGKLERNPDLVSSIHGKLVDLGIQKSGYPPEYGGTGPASAMTFGIIIEELARGDAGIAHSVGVNAGGLGIAMQAQNKAVLERFAPAFCGDKVNYACFAITESTGGADAENPLLSGRGIKTRARLAGDEWVINGTKSWPTHAGIASVYVAVCTTGPEAAEDGIALIYVPHDATGLSFGKPEEKMGYRSSINASVFFDNVRVPKAFRAAGPGADARLFNADVMAGGPWSNAGQSLGIAQAAFDTALEYTEGRKSDGRAVREWSLAAGMLADMAIRLEMMRGAFYNFAWMLDHPDDYGAADTPKMISKASILRTYAADGCVYVTNKAIELMGANGLSPDYHLEKYLRDAKITQIVLGGQQIARYRVVRGYYDYRIGSSGEAS